MEDRMIVIDNSADFLFDRDLLQRVHEAAGAGEREVELILTDNARIQELNRDYRQIDRPTDVLSFPLEDVPHMPMGTIVISVDKVQEKAKELGHSTDAELALLYLHGLLHLMGYDHETDSGEMREKEAGIIRALHLPDSLILRTQ